MVYISEYICWMNKVDTTQSVHPTLKTIGGIYFLYICIYMLYTFNSVLDTLYTLYTIQCLPNAVHKTLKALCLKGLCTMWFIVYSVHLLWCVVLGCISMGYTGSYLSHIITLYQYINIITLYQYINIITLLLI